MTGIDNARKVAGKMKADIEERKEVEKKNYDTAMAEINDNEQLIKLYKENALVGSDNLSGQTPSLKIHTTGRSTNNQLADGSEPNDGWFFYGSTGQQFQTVQAHILAISRGFKAKGLTDGKEVFNQLM